MSTLILTSPSIQMRDSHLSFLSSCIPSSSLLTYRKCVPFILSTVFQFDIFKNFCCAFICCFWGSNLMPVQAKHTFLPLNYVPNPSSCFRCSHSYRVVVLPDGTIIYFQHTLYSIRIYFLKPKVGHVIRSFQHSPLPRE